MSFEKKLHSYTEVILPVGGLCDPNVLIGCLRDQTWLCVLLVSNARGCCLVPRRDNTRGSLSPTIYIQSCLIPIITWCHHIFPQLPIFCSLKSIWSLNREQPQSPLPRHHVILGESIAVAPTPGRENARASFCRRLSVWNRTASRGDNEVDHAVCLKAEFLMPTVLPN